MTDTYIHPAAIVEDGAEIGEGCHIGPFCYIGAGVRLGSGLRLHSHVVVVGDTEIGDDTEIWPHSSIGHAPQDLKFSGEKTRLQIGKRNKIRESTSINPGTTAGGGVTTVGDDCLLMLGAHIGHDAHIGNQVVMANNVSIAGHVTIGDGAIIGGLVGIHQFCRIGRGAMIGALCAVAQDVMPYASVIGERPHIAGLNVIGLRRRGLDRPTIHALRHAQDALFDGEAGLRRTAQAMLEDDDHNPYVTDMLEFIAAGSERSFLGREPRAK